MTYVMLTKKIAIKEFLDIVNVSQPMWTVSHCRTHPNIYFIRQEVFSSDLAKALV